MTYNIKFTFQLHKPINNVIFIGWHIMTGLVDSSVRGMRTSLIRSFPNINDVIAFRGEAVNRLKFGIQAIVDTSMYIVYEQRYWVMYRANCCVKPLK